MVRCYEIEKSQTNWKTIWFFQIQVAIYYLSYLLHQNRNTASPYMNWKTIWFFQIQVAIYYLSYLLHQNRNTASPYICKNIILFFSGYMKTIFRSRLIWKFAW